jgi:outer membrane protein assembly factor BamB
MFSLGLIAVMCVSVSAQVADKKKDSVRFNKPLSLEKAGEAAPTKQRAPDARPVGNVEALPLTDADKLSLERVSQFMNVQTDFQQDAAPRGFSLKHTTQSAWIRRITYGNPRSPATSGDLVVVGSGGGNLVYGINIETGERKWTNACKDSGISNIEIDGDSAYYTTYSCTLERVRVLTGKTVNSTWISSTVDNQPVVSNGRAYCSYQGQGGVRLSAHDVDSGAEKWSVVTGGAGGIQGPVVADGCVMLATVDGSLGTYDVGTGSLKWKASLGLTTAPVAVPGGVLCVTPAEQTLVEEKREEPKAEEQPAKPESEKDSIVPVKPSTKGVLPGTLITQGKVSLGLLSATEAPKTSVVSGVQGPRGGLDYQGARPGFDGEMAFFAAGGHISALALGSNARQWDVAILGGEGMEFTTPVVCGGLVISATNTGYVFALSRRTGTLIWSYRFNGQSFMAKPAIGKDRLLITSASGALISIPIGLSSAATVSKESPEAEIAREFQKNRTDEAPKPIDPNAGGSVDGKLPEAVRPPADPEPAPPTPVEREVVKGEFERAEKRKAEREAAKGKEYEPKKFRRE